MKASRWRRTPARRASSWVETQRGAFGVLMLAGVVVIGIGIKLAAPLLVPCVLAVLVTTVSTPVVEWLEHRGVPRSLAIGIAVMVDAAVLTGLGALVIVSASQLAANLPEYAELARSASGRATTWLQRLSPTLTLPDLVDTAALSRVVASTLASAAGFIWNAMLAVIVAAFLLFELTKPADDGRRAARGSPARRAMAEVNKYVAIKTLTSATTGVAVALWLWLVGGDLPVLFGLLAFVLNYIPNIGSILAAAPAIALAFLEGGASAALLVAAGYVGVNVVIGNVVEPRIMGRALGLSPLVVLLSVIVWGLLLGPVGALLSALLTVFVKLVLSSTKDLRPLAQHLGPTPRDSAAAGASADLVEVVVPQTERSERSAS